jgi:hypothetical protein
MSAKMSPALGDLIGMPGCKWNYENPRHSSSICSVTSSKLVKLAGKHLATNIISYHKDYFTRVYPSGTKIDSSNYNPVDAWVMGAHMVALNLQTPDVPVLLNKAWFAYNGGITNGYVMKPAYRPKRSR